MSRSPTPDPSAPYSDQPDALANLSISASASRTVAIIKNHALAHRFDIEPRILKASFEIVKERQMEFDPDSDPEYLQELFGEDAESLLEGPVWVYVLERRRAVEVWNTLMGDPDPEIARENAPNSLRALYGISLEKNGIMGSANAQIAELQIASLFASSPPFPMSELPELGVHEHYSSGVHNNATSDEGYAHSQPSTLDRSTSKHSQSGKVFRARALPKTHEAPDIVPRTTRAAALRAGAAPERPVLVTRPRAPLPKGRLQQTFANVPGHKRTETITVASVAPPVIAPKMTKAASLRIGQPAPSAVKRRPVSVIVAGMRSADPTTFDGVPGHKRRESIAVASVKAPTVAPRLNKSAALRASKDAAPPTSFMFRGATTPKTPGVARSASQCAMHDKSSLHPTSQVDFDRPARPASSIATRSNPSLSASQRSNDGAHTPTPPNGKRAAESSPARPVTATGAPTIAPRTNKSALLRAAKMEREAAAGAGKTGKTKVTSRAMVH